MWTPLLPIKRFHNDAIIPTYGSDGAIGLDLHACPEGHMVFIPPGGRCVVPTGIGIAVPQGWYGRLAPRSGLAVKHGIDVLAGVIDADYRGEIKVVLVNFGDSAFDIRTGDRIAQLILERADRFSPAWAFNNELPATSRGTGGFGSTGVKPNAETV
jgi:dUTP pyrophosphatase